MRTIILSIVLAASLASAKDVARVWDNGDGTVRVERVRSFNEAEPLSDRELTRLDYNVEIPCLEQYLAWSGTSLVRADTGTCARVDSRTAAERGQPISSVIGHATVNTYSDGTLEIVGPLVVPGSTNGSYEIVVDPQTGLVFGELDHASPRKSKEARDAAKAARRQKIDAVRSAQTRNSKVDALLDLLGFR